VTILYGANIDFNVSPLKIDNENILLKMLKDYQLRYRIYYILPVPLNNSIFLTKKQYGL